jgi:transcriptional regulator with XRE-family HTH domain
MKHNELTAETREAQRKRQREILGTAIRARREKLGLTQGNLARSLGKSVATISKIESGAQAMDVTTLGEFASALGLDSSKLLLQSLEKTAKTDYQIELNRIYRKVVYGKQRTRRAKRRAA